jgi:hypothetical protein
MKKVEQRWSCAFMDGSRFVAGQVELGSGNSNRTDKKKGRSGREGIKMNQGHNATRCRI